MIYHTQEEHASNYTNGAVYGSWIYIYLCVLPLKFVSWIAVHDKVYSLQPYNIDIICKFKCQVATMRTQLAL